MAFLPGFVLPLLFISVYSSFCTSIDEKHIWTTLEMHNVVVILSILAIIDGFYRWNTHNKRNQKEGILYSLTIIILCGSQLGHGDHHTAGVLILRTAIEVWAAVKSRDFFVLRSLVWKALANYRTALPICCLSWLPCSPCIPRGYCMTYL